MSKLWDKPEIFSRNEGGAIIKPVAVTFDEDIK